MNMTFQSRTNADPLGWLIDDFPAISLGALNDKAAMMARIDNKYIVRRGTLESILPNLLETYDILEIDGVRAFTYDTRYFDDEHRSAYREHHQGRRKGFKVRVRRYAEAGLCFLEVKVKGKRGMTIKHRQPYDPRNLGTLTSEARDFAARTYSDHYRMPFGYDLGRALDIRYQRITLVARKGGERMTIDGRLRFRTAKDGIEASPDVFIVETKSANGRGLADRWLRRAGSHPTGKCSKYCIGISALGEAPRSNRFLPVMRRLGLEAAASAA